MDNATTNCEACGAEFLKKEAKALPLRGFSHILRVCSSCHSKSPEESLKTAADILFEIEKIAKNKKDPGERLSKIKDLLGD